MAADTQAKLSPSVIPAKASGDGHIGVGVAMDSMGQSKQHKSAETDAADQLLGRATLRMDIIIAASENSHLVGRRRLGERNNAPCCSPRRPPRPFGPARHTRYCTLIPRLDFLRCFPGGGPTGSVRMSASGIVPSSAVSTPRVGHTQSGVLARWLMSEGDVTVHGARSVPVGSRIAYG